MPSRDNPPAVLVTGATGAIGPILVKRLLSEGYRVRALIRKAPAPELLPPQVELVQGDIADEGTLTAATLGVDIVFHLASKLHLSHPPPQLRKEYERVNLEGTSRLAQASCRAGVGRLVYFSTISVYGPTAVGQIVDETSPCSPETMYAQTKYAAERVALEARRRSDGQPLTVVLRLAAVYGTRMKGNYVHLARGLRRGWFVPVGSGENRRTLVHQVDAVAAAILAAQLPKAAGQVYNVTDGSIHSIQKILTAMCSALGRRPPRIHLPAAPIRFLARVAQSGLQLLGKNPPISPALIDKLLEDVAVDGSLIQRDLGFRPRVALEEGWKETLQYAKAPGSRSQIPDSDSILKPKA